MFENTDLYGTNCRKLYFECFFMLSYQIYAHLESRRTFLQQIIDDFPAVWNYGKLSAKFLVSWGKVIDTVGFLSFFKVLLE